MVVNGDAFLLDERGAVESIASKLAPTIIFDCSQILGTPTNPVGEPAREDGITFNISVD
jgi:hypothetical protein